MHYADEMVKLGLWDAVRLVPETAREEVLVDLAYERTYLNEPNGIYAGAYDDRRSEDHECDIGGES